MAFAPYWPLDVENHYMLAWFMARDQAAVATARQAIDRLLAADPHGNGTHVAEGLWKITVPPLLVHFEIDDPATVVTVTQLDLVP